MNYTPAKLYKAKTGNDWYILFYCIDPETGEKEPFKERKGINRIKDKKERKKAGDKLVVKINGQLEQGWNPFKKGGDDKADELKNVVAKNRLDFYWWFDEKIKQELARGDAGYYNWKNVTQAKKRLVEFKPDLLVSEMDYKLLKDFESHLLKKGSSLNNISFIMDKVKVIVSSILKSGDILYHKNPFLAYKAKTTAVQSKRLSIDELGKLRDIELEIADEDFARDMYVFSFYHAGMRWGDVCRVKKSWFQKTHTDYTMNKSKKARNLKTMPEAQKVIDKYINTPGEYLFDTKVDWSEASKSIDVRNTYYNRKLKLACGKAEIPKISFHTSRHSIGDLAVSKGMDIRGIKDLFGHSKTATTERYLLRFYKEKSDQSMDTLFGE